MANPGPFDEINQKISDLSNKLLSELGVANRHYYNAGLRNRLKDVDLADYYIDTHKDDEEQSNASDTSKDSDDSSDTDSDDSESKDDDKDKKDNSQLNESNKLNAFNKMYVPPVRTPKEDSSKDGKIPWNVRDNSYIPIVVLSTISGTYPLVPRTYSHYLPEGARDKFYADIVSVQTQNLMSNDIPTSTITLGNEYDWSSVVAVNDLVRIDIVDPNDLSLIVAQDYAPEELGGSAFGGVMHNRNKLVPVIGFKAKGQISGNDYTPEMIIPDEDFINYDFASMIADSSENTNGDANSDDSSDSDSPTTNQPEDNPIRDKYGDESIYSGDIHLGITNRIYIDKVDIPNGAEIKTYKDRYTGEKTDYYGSGQSVFNIVYGLVASTNRQSDYNEGKTTHTIVCQGMAKIFTNIQLATFSELSANMSGYQMLPDDEFNGIAFGGHTSASIILQIINKFVLQNRGGMNTYDFENVESGVHGNSITSTSTAIRAGVVSDLMGEPISKDFYNAYLDYVDYMNEKNKQKAKSDDSDKDSDDDLSGDEAEARDWIVQHESGGNYEARNPSNPNVYGKYQLTLDKLHGDLSPANQDKIANEYVKSRYGSWVKAKQFWQAHNWY